MPVQDSCDATAALTALVQHQADLDREHRGLSDYLKRLRKENDALRMHQSKCHGHINELKQDIASQKGHLKVLEIQSAAVRAHRTTAYRHQQGIKVGSKQRLCECMYAVSATCSTRLVVVAQVPLHPS